MLISSFTQFWERTIHENWELFKEKVKALTDKYIPTRRLSRSRAPWFSISLQRLLNKKKRIFRRYKLSTSAVRWQAYISAASEYKRALFTAKRTFFNQTLPDLLSTNPRRFWNVVNTRKTNEIRLKSTSGHLVPREKCFDAL